jgi:hypothetical protein
VVDPRIPLLRPSSPSLVIPLLFLLLTSRPSVIMGLLRSLVNTLSEHQFLVAVVVVLAVSDYPFLPTARVGLARPAAS